MDKEDRIKIDQGKEKWLQLITDLNEIVAGYGLEARTTNSQESKRRAKADSGILKRVVDLYKISLEQYEQINKQADLIIRIRKEIEQLKDDIKSLKK